MIDKGNKAERYFAYLRQLMRKEFSGSVTVDFFKGGICSLTKESEPVIQLKVKEAVKLKRGR